MTRNLKLTVATLMTAVVATLGVSTVALADAGIADSKGRSLCC